MIKQQITQAYKRLYKNTNNKILFFVALLMVSFVQPVGAAGLVPCEGIDDCNFDTLVKLLNNLASFIMFRLPIILLVIVFAWNGAMLIYKSNRAGAIKDIKKNLWNVLLGYLLIVGAYILVKTFIVLLAGQELSFKVFFN